MMKNFLIALCALSIQLTLPWHCSLASAQKPEKTKTQNVSSRSQSKRAWRAATYSGLTIGKSNRLDMLHALGEPKRVDTMPPGQTVADENPEVWYVYESTGELPGELTVVVDELTSIVLRIDMEPKNLTKEIAVKHFGSDFILTRYAFDECLGDEESGPIYESPSGPMLELEYRHRGIALSLTSDGKVSMISYVSKPIGSPTSKCASSTTALRPR